MGDADDLNGDDIFETDRARERTDDRGDFSFSTVKNPASACNAEVSSLKEGGFEYIVEKASEEVMKGWVGSVAC